MTNSKLIEFNQNGDERGYLVAMESESEGIPFLIKRAFYIYGSGQDTIRGCHANYTTEFILVNVQGSCKVKTDNGHGNVITYNLNKRNQGVYIPSMVWKDMYDFSDDCIMLVLASEHYDPSEYIRDYQLFIKRVKEDSNRHLRRLEESDAPFMLEWMSDPSINRFFKFSSESLNIESVLNFIRKAQNDYEDQLPLNLHYAVADGADEYFGTVSLKNIDQKNRTAEYAISTRSIAKHRGYGQFATTEIIRIAFEKIKLEQIYLYVLPENEAAIKMYKKCGFTENPLKDDIDTINGKKVKRLRFEINRNDYYIMQGAKGTRVTNK